MKQNSRKSNLLATIFLLFFLIALLGIAFFAKQIGIHDTGEYIVQAKNLAGIGNVEPYTFHSIIYPLFLSAFLRIFPALLTIKIINILWLCLIGLTLFIYTKNTKALLLWIVSPLVWFISIETTPMLPLSFFFLLAYIFMKEFEEKKKFSLLLCSGFFLGITLALWTGALFLVFSFMFFFLWNKSFKQASIYGIFFLLGLSLQFVVDFIFLDFPFYTLLRYFGGNLYYLVFGIEQQPTLLLLLRMLFFIAPLCLLILKIDFKKYGREMLLIASAMLFFYLRGRNPDGFKLAITFAPMLLLVVSKVLTKRLFIINTLLAILLTGFFILPPYFTNTADQDVIQDFKDINKDFGFEKVIAGKDQELLFGSLSWSAKPIFIWWDSYEALQQKEEKEYRYILPKKEHRIMELSVAFNIETKEEYSKLPLILRKNQEVPPEFTLVKEYKELKVYQPLNSFH